MSSSLSLAAHRNTFNLLLAFLLSSQKKKETGMTGNQSLPVGWGKKTKKTAVAADRDR